MSKTRTRAAVVRDVFKMYQLKVELPPIEPPIWRRLLVRGDMNLGLLHAVIQVSMGWTNSHLHHFLIGDEVYTDSVFEENLDSGEEPDRDESKATLITVAPRAKARFVYEYDFGDSWQHLITVEKILEPVASFQGFAKCLDGGRACPPEDCGGAWGYGDVLKIIKNRRHKEHKSMMEWLGGEFNPEAFDVERANKCLQKLKWPHTTIDHLAKVLMARDDYRE
jgi:hypothetical protein